LNSGSLNSAHIHGTCVPVQEPSTASFAEVNQLMRPKRNRTHVDALIRHHRPFLAATGDGELVLSPDLRWATHATISHRQSRSRWNWTAAMPEMPRTDDAYWRGIETRRSGRAHLW